MRLWKGLLGLLSLGINKAERLTDKQQCTFEFFAKVERA